MGREVAVVLPECKLVILLGKRQKSEGGTTVSGSWVQTDEAVDVSGSIRHVIRTSAFIEADPQAWKWVVLALHSALQGACVCHLTTTASPVGALTNRNTGEWLAYFKNSRTDSNAKPPATYIKSLPELLKAVRKPHSAGDRSNLNGVKISEHEFRWISDFHEGIRNQFVHFEPMGWSIEVSGIPKIAQLVVRIIREIDDLGWAFRHQEPSEKSELRKDLCNIEKIDWPC
uniref:hypothetical protein n=1 Tax=Parerythrobacter lutipelagi TaxID=1964208 RepID=UPI00195E8815|nr:hypothetical protein [Parerythrobacter lutipelagi]